MAKSKKLPSGKPRALHASGRVPLHVRYKDPITGKPRQKMIYGKDEAEAQRNKRAFLLEIDKGLRMAEQGKTVGDWAEEWLVTYKKPKVSRRTYANYEAEIKIIKQAMGYKPLRSITELDIVALMNTRAGLSESAIRHTYIIVNAIFRAAVRNRMIQFNPCEGVELPEGTTGTHRALEHWEIDLIEKVAQTHRLGYGIMLMLWAGCRRAEACAFTSDDIEGDELRIRESIEWFSNQPAIKNPKSEAGTRMTPIFPKLRPFLSKQGYAVTNAQGKGPVSRSAFTRAFNSFVYHCEECLNGCSKRWQPESHVWRELKFTPHDLRHTWFTMLYDAGVDVKVAASWGGHADPAVTQKIYQHIRLERSKKEAKEAIKRVEIMDQIKANGSKSGSNRKTYRLKRLDK
ncbi:MAG: tyrosine-type recombinase/integrase [Christensenellales bacterium]|jgi:integrase